MNRIARSRAQGRYLTSQIDPDTTCIMHRIVCVGGGKAGPYMRKRPRAALSDACLEAHSPGIRHAPACVALEVP
jgi:hypothetical protein